MPGGMNLKYEEKVVQCEKRVYRTRIATSALIRQGV